MVQLNPQMMSAEAHAHLAFFQRKWVQTILPFSTSLALHLGLIVFGYSIYRVARVITTIHSVEQTIVVESDLTPVAPTAVPNLGEFGNAHDPLHALTQAVDANDSDPQSYNVKHGTGAANFNPGGDEAADASMAGFGSHATGGTGGLGIGPAGAGPLARFGPGGGGDLNSSPLPKHVESPKVVFVCDATGSMNGIFGGLRSELQSTIDHLQISQAFNVIFFSDNQVLNLNPAGLLLATPANKTKALNFMTDVSPRGLTNPLPAIREAFAQKPEMIYVLTDGFDQVDSLESVYNEFATLNKDGKVRVNTILIGSQDQKELVDLLQRIAKDNHGVMKVVSRDAF